MAQRRTHKKSKLGCQDCKRRHIKVLLLSDPAFCFLLYMLLHASFKKGLADLRVQSYFPLYPTLALADGALMIVR